MAAYARSPHDESVVTFALGAFILVWIAIALAVVLTRTYAAVSEPPEYITAGVGADEIERLKSREREFNLKLVFTLAEGNYVSDVEVVVKDDSGNPVLVAHVPGPVLLAKLPRGAYVVDTKYDGRIQSRKLDVGERLSTEYVRWPSNPETDFRGPKATEKE